MTAPLRTDHHEATRLLIMTVLWQQLSPRDLEVTNDSARHKGHREAQRQPDKGHFIVSIEWSAGSGNSRLQQHRIVYAALEGLMHRIHALSINIVEPS